jgi:hypothetical protein
MIGFVLTLVPIDRIVAIDSSLPAFHVDPHRGAERARTMEATTQ